MSRIVSKKKCSLEGCNSPLFARGYCSYHYKIEYLAAKQREKQPRSYTISRNSVKRTSQESEYQRKRKAFISLEKAHDKLERLFCIFCGGIIFSEPDIHHLNGRDNEMLLDDRYWAVCHRDCHVHEYHSMSWEKLPWWKGYLERIKELYPGIYQKELQKMEK